MQEYRILVGVIACFDSHFLLLRRSMQETFMPGAWGIPAGKVDFGEDLEDAALRELSEEAGLVGEMDNLVGYSFFMSEKDGKAIHNVQINFRVQCKHQDIMLDPSNDLYEWVSFDSLEVHQCDEFTKKALRQAI